MMKIMKMLWITVAVTAAVWVCGCGSREVKIEPQAGSKGREALQEQFEAMKRMGVDPTQNVIVYRDRKTKTYHLAGCEDFKGATSGDRSSPDMAAFSGYKPCEKCIGAMAEQRPAGQ